MIHLDAAYALRSMKKRPAFTAVIVLILAIGIGANTAMFGTLNTVLLRPLPYPEPDRLVMGRATFNGRINPFASGYDYYDYREQSQSFVALAALTGFTAQYTITGGEEPELVEGTFATWDLFKTLGVDPVIGTHFSPEVGGAAEANVVILSYGYWQQGFAGSPEILGTSLVVDGMPHTVVGVLPAGFHFLFDVDIWRPTFRDGPGANARRWHNLLLVGRLAPGISIAEAQGEVDVISRQLEEDYPDTNRNKALQLTGLHSALVESARTGLWLLMAALSLVLLIACGNVAGLLLARGFGRQTEMAVRASLGASRRRLVVQLLTESLVLAILAGALGVALALIFQDLLLQLLPMGQLGITRIAVDTPVLVFALGISLATGLLFGTVPALRVTAFHLVEQIKAGPRSLTPGRTLLRSGLVVAQVAISLMLLFGSALLIRSFARQIQVDLGFDPTALLTAELRLPSDDYADEQRRVGFFTSLVEEVQSLPGVVSVGLISQLPIRDPGNNIYVYPADRPPTTPSDGYSAYVRLVLPGYFETMGMPLVAGRDIAERDGPESPRVLVISEAMARALYPDREALGRQVIVDTGEPTPFEIVGVVADARLSALREGRFLAMYGSYRQIPQGRMRIAVRTAGEPASLIGPLTALLRRKDRDVPLAEPATMEAIIADSVADFRVVTSSLSLLAAIALSLAAVGLYGVLAYDVSQRHHEIGLRMALGARAADLLTRVVGRGLVLVGIGWILGIAGAVATARWIRQLLFETEATDPLSFVMVTVFLGLVALGACTIPAVRAVRINPARALHSE